MSVSVVQVGRGLSQCQSGVGGKGVKSVSRWCRWKGG